MGSSDVVIRVEGLGKKYALHHEKAESYSALRDVVARKAKAAGRLLNPFTLTGQLRKAQREAAVERAASEEEFWALKDVSFEIRRGERVGIIGRNGAGKSTLLKILSRITEPTTGRVEICGRVASLLEVGTGFHQELTGRENIYLNGAILGMKRQEIRSKFDEIVDFAEVERFLDTPVKRYSSGMYVKLAFAVAAYLEPEILVVDEVLAVGDSSFQKKCIGKMQEVAESEGRTILFVSHNIAAIKQLCNNALILKNGSIVLKGKPVDVIEKYISSFANNCLLAKWDDPIEMPGDHILRLKQVEIRNLGETCTNLRIDRPIEVLIRYCIVGQLSTSCKTIGSSIHVNTPEGVLVFVSGVAWDPKINTGFPFEDLRGEFIDKCIIPANYLNDSSYSIDVYLLSNHTNLHALARNVIEFKAEEGIRSSSFCGYTGSIGGIVRPSLLWKTIAIR